MFYGTTTAGGVGAGSAPSCSGQGCGTIFKITPTGTLTTLYNFSSFSAPDGASPGCPLIQSSDGNFYGTTLYGGTHGVGTVFKMNPAGTLTTLYSFGSSTSDDGYSPQAALTLGTDGNFYGTTQASRGASAQSSR